MRIHDRVYGDFDITGILAELVESGPVQRLKGIHQGGASYLVNEKWNITRYDHSVGVMLLIRRLGGCLEEQIVGLLHDISHTAFSHVVDYVFDNRDEDYHEKIFEQVVMDSVIPEILRKYDLDCDLLFSGEDRWGILDQPAPELCADRIDYTLRDLLQNGMIEEMEVDPFIESLAVINGKIFVNSLEMAEWFVDAYYKEVIDYFLDPLNVYAYEILAHALKVALESKEVSLSDLLETDQVMIEKLSKTGNERVLDLLKQLNTRVQVEEREGGDYDFHHVKKVRLIDPSVVVGERSLPASKLSGRVRQSTAAAMKRSLKGTCVKVIRNGVVHT